MNGDQYRAGDNAKMIDRSTGRAHLFNLSVTVLKADHYRDLFLQIIHELPLGDIIPLFITVTANADDCKSVTFTQQLVDSRTLICSFVNLIKF